MYPTETIAVAALQGLASWDDKTVAASDASSEVDERVRPVDDAERS
jgi:hypothetical protein